MPDPIPPDEWSWRIQAADGSGHAFPPRPDVVEVTGDDLGPAAGTTGHEGHRPDDAPLRASPQLLAPEAEPGGGWRPRWQRPPGQHDDRGEPTGGAGR